MNTKSGNKSVLLISGLCIILIITALRAIRLPNDWAEAHWLLNYDLSFIKRLLPGTIFKPFIYLNNASDADFFIHIISSSILLIFFIVLIYICIRITRKFNFNVISVSAVLVFLTSPYIVMSAHLNGYTDNILILSSVAAVMFILNRKIWTASLIIFVTVFIHESILFVGLPSIICIAYFQYLRKNSIKIKTITGFLIKYFPVFILPIIAFIIILLNQILFINEETEKQLVMHLSKFDFIQNDRNHLVPEELTKSFFTYFEAETPKFFRRIVSPSNIIRILLPLSLIMLFIRKIIKSIRLSGLYFVFVLSSVILPLALHLVAWDTPRIWTYPLIAAVLILWGISESLQDERIGTYYSPFIFIVAVLILNIFIRTPLMDSEVERFSNVLRILLYFPPLVLIFFLLFKNRKKG